MKQMMNEIRKYITEGYPGNYDCMCFGASVDKVKTHLRKCAERPKTVADLLAYIETVLEGCGEDPRFPPSVAAYLVRQGIVSFDDRTGDLMWPMPSGLRRR